MARGKAAAQAANRRLAEAQDRIAELERLLNAERDQYRVDIREVREERDRAKDRLIREVDKLSEQAIQQSEEAARRRVDDVQAICDLRVKNALTFLSTYVAEDGFDFAEREKWEKFSQIIGLHMTDVLAAMGASHNPKGGNRKARRHRPGKGCSCGRCDQPMQVVSVENEGIPFRHATRGEDLTVQPVEDERQVQAVLRLLQDRV